jgi:hypothetical protein
MSALKAILLAVISTVIGGTIVAFFTYYLNAPEKASVHAEYQYVKVPSPSYRIFDGLRAAALKDGLLDISPETFDVLRRAVDLSIVTTTVKNDSDLKSRKIELSIPLSMVWFAIGDRNTPTRTVNGSKIIIDSLGPGESKQLVAISTDIYRGPVLQAVHDDKKINVFSTVIDTDDPTGVAPALAVAYPMLVLLLMFVGAAAIFLIVVIGGLSSLISSQVKWQAKFATPKQLKTYQQILDYARANFPDKMKEASL